MYVYDGGVLVELEFHYENLAKHGVTPEEVAECFEDPGSWTERSRDDTYLCIGKTLQGRLLEVGYDRLSSTKYFVFHAMDATWAKRKRYKKRNKS